MKEIIDKINKPEFPRSAKYDAEWMLDNQMGPNALWLLEWLCESVALAEGMRVLDLGCGKAMTSIFIAQEFGARVWATDLWMSPDNNWQRVKEAGVADLVCPIKAEAHALPFAEGFFDAIISVDAYQYFGTDDLYIDYLARLLRPEGELGVVVPGLMQEFDNGPPEYLTKPQKNGKVFWEAECRCFKTAAFWDQLWRGSALVEDVKVSAQPDGWRHWRDFEQAIEASGKGIFPSDAEALEADAGRFIGFLALAARRTQKQTINIYDPSLGVQAGAE